MTLWNRDAVWLTENQNVLCHRKCNEIQFKHTTTTTTTTTPPTTTFCVCQLQCYINLVWVHRVHNTMWCIRLQAIYIMRNGNGSYKQYFKSEWDISVISNDVIFLYFTYTTTPWKVTHKISRYIKNIQRVYCGSMKVEWIYWQSNWVIWLCLVWTVLLVCSAIYAHEYKSKPNNK